MKSGGGRSQTAHGPAKPMRNSAFHLVGMIGAVVLAAGESTRMGRPKALLPFRGQTFLERCLAVLRDSRVNGITVVLGHDGEAILRALRLEACTVVVNDRYREGLSTSVAAGLRALPSRVAGALMVPVDQPLLTAAVVDQILRAHRESGKAIVVPTSGGVRGTPVLIGRRLFSEAEALRGDIGFRALFPAHDDDLLEVPVGDPRALLDVDTEADLERAQQLAEG